MRAFIDLTEAQAAALDELSKAEKKSRAALIRLAIDSYLAKQREKRAFGLWLKKK